MSTSAVPRHAFLFVRYPRLCALRLAFLSTCHRRPIRQLSTYPEPRPTLDIGVQILLSLPLPLTQCLSSVPAPFS